jgi:bifunctional DNA-binding transcriptional regulator/antitoxin component of YhaV-PrlF toxin-antitoxin module
MRLIMGKTSKIAKANALSSSVRATIPNDIVEYLGLRIGDVIDWERYTEKGRKYARIKKLE